VIFGRHRENGGRGGKFRRIQAARRETGDERGREGVKWGVCEMGGFRGALFGGEGALGGRVRGGRFHGALWWMGWEWCLVGEVRRGDYDKGVDDVRVVKGM
jgi:hypothetical protein